MHYYKRNLGDYAKKCGRLSMLQHGSYTLLIDACYDREKFPTLEEAIDWTWASTESEVEAVKFVLHKFFTLEDGVYVQKRIQEEIAEYHAKADKNKQIANDREANRRKKETNRERTVNEPLPDVTEAPPNHKPRTINQEPIPPYPQAGDEVEQQAKVVDHPSAADLRFENFWQAYPRKKAKDAARKAFDKRRVDDALLADMLGAIATQSHSDEWTKDGGQFIPHPATWLNQGRWQDEAPMSATPTPLFAGAI